MTEGVYRGVPESEYHSWPELSASRLKKMEHPDDPLQMLPAQYKHSLDAPFLGTAATLLGSAVHLAILFPETWAANIEESKYKTTCQGFFAEREEGPEKTWLLSGQREKVEAMQEAFLCQPGDMADHARSILGGATDREVSLKFELAGEPMKARIDMAGNDYVADLKTVGAKGGASARAFSRHALDYGYLRQAAIYAKGAELAGLMKEPCEIFYFIALEVEPPHLVNVFAVNSYDLLLGIGQAMQYIVKIRECKDSGEWPGYESHEVPVLQHPEWCRDKLNETVSKFLDRVTTQKEKR